MAPKSKKPSTKRVKQAAKRSRPPVTRPPSPPIAAPPSSHHIRPPSIHSGNPSIHILLLDDRARTRYQSFRNKPFVPMYRLTSSFIDSLHITKLHDLLSAQPMTKFILDNTDCVFPGMVGQFFANLTFAVPSSRNVIISQVNRVRIRLDWQTLNTIYETALPDPDTTLLYWDDSHLWPGTCEKFKISELHHMFRVSSREAKHFNPTNLDPVDRVIYHLLANFINPVAGHFTSPGKIPLVYYYLFTHQIPIDWGFVVFNRLADTVTDKRRNLPHASFLTPIFRHFNIPFNESGVLPPLFDMGALTKKGIRLHEGTWITRQAYLSLVTPSSASHPASAAPSNPQSFSISASIQQLQKSVNHLLRHVLYLEHGVEMALSDSRREEFKSDKILFGLSSTESDSEPAASTHDGNDSTDGAPAHSSSADLSEHSSSAESASTASASRLSMGDEPLIRRFKKSKTLP